MKRNSPRWAIEEAYAALEAPCYACGKVHPYAKRHVVCVTPEGYLTEEAKSWPARKGKELS